MHRLGKTNLKVHMNLVVITNDVRYTCPVPLESNYPCFWETMQWLSNLEYGETIEYDIDSYISIILPRKSGMYFDEKTEARLLKQGHTKEGIASLKKNAVYNLPF